MIKLKQAVILCGGLGTRLRPHTLDKPKIMVECNGKPFLFYLIEQLQNQKIKEVILCTGYKNKIINKYLKNIYFENIKISSEYSRSNTNTGTRLKRIEDKLDQHFLLLYSDNFTHLNLEKRIKKFSKSKNLIDLTVVKKNNGNIKISDNNIIYSKIRSKASKYVEVSYSICSKNILNFYNSRNNTLQIILNKISVLNKLSVTINDKYYSISDPKRLKITEKFFKQKKILLIDRDGIINRKPKKGYYVNTKEKLLFLNKNLNFFSNLSKIGFKFIIVTNQAGINRGMIKINNYKKINLEIFKKFKKENINLLEIFTCPHHWDEKCDCRKPKTGLFFDISKKYNLKLDQYIFIGDSITDMQTTDETFCKGIFINRKKNINSKNIVSFNNLLDAKDYILKYYGIQYQK